MKKILLVFFAISQVAMAARSRPGSECGLVDYTDDQNWQAVRDLDLEKLTPFQMTKLSTLRKQQLIIAAKRMVTVSHLEVEINNTVDAVEFLTNSSAASEAYLRDFTVRGEKVTAVIFYPGDNEYGVVFDKGTTHRIAEIGDGEVLCR